MKLLFSAVALMIGVVSSGADVYFVEEVVNPGFGAKKTGARKTTSKVYIKGKQQKRESSIEADKKTVKALRDQGQPLLSSTILRLDKDEVFEIDLDAQTFVQTKIPPAAKKVAKKAKSTNPKIRFAVKEPGDTTRIAGVLCKRVVAQMRARYFDPKTKKVRRENRYTYDAWVARDFPGYQEIKAFQNLQAAKTSYPPLIGGGLGQLRETVEDYDQLVSELDALEGFVMRSTIRVSVVRPSKKGEIEVFRLERQVKSLMTSALPDSVFGVSRALTKVKGE
jgi:hypothetical protein